MPKLPRRAALGLAAAAAMPRFAIAQSDPRPVVTIAVQNMSTSNTLEMLSASWGRTGQPWLANQWRNEEFGALAAELETSMDQPRRIAVWRRMLEIVEREDPGYVVLHRNAAFVAKRRDIKWRASQSFFMDFRGSNWAA